MPQRSKRYKIKKVVHKILQKKYSIQKVLIIRYDTAGVALTYREINNFQFFQMLEHQKLKLFLTLIFVKWSKKSTYFKNPSEPL